MNAIPNLFSLARIPLAFLFLSPDPLLRALSVTLALITDFLDGYLARKFRWTSRAGAILDPLADRFYIFFCLAVIVSEVHPTIWQVATFFARDLSLGLFAIWMWYKGAWKRIKLEATWCGKVTTVLQLVLLLATSFHLSVGPVPYLFLVVIAAMNWVELFARLQEA